MRAFRRRERRQARTVAANVLPARSFTHFVPPSRTSPRPLRRRPTTYHPSVGSWPLSSTAALPLLDRKPLATTVQQADDAGVAVRCARAWRLQVGHLERLTLPLRSFRGPADHAKFRRVRAASGPVSTGRSRRLGRCSPDDPITSEPLHALDLVNVVSASAALGVAVLRAGPRRNFGQRLGCGSRPGCHLHVTASGSGPAVRRAGRLLHLGALRLRRHGLLCIGG